MSERFKLPSGKEVKRSVRMLTQKDLDEMGLTHESYGIFFNRTKSNKKFPKVSQKIKKNMAIMNYHDFSQVPFSDKELKKSIMMQIKSTSGDFIVLSRFKGETQYDTRRKIELAGNIKLKLEVKKEIVVEIPHDSTITAKDLAELSHNFDSLSIFYNTHWGGYPSLVNISETIRVFKQLTSKKIYCVSIPMKFPGEGRGDSRFMPIFGLICDAWVKCWRKGMSSKIIKVVDKKDLRSKSREDWLVSGYSLNQVLDEIQRTVYVLFQDDKEGKKAREEYGREVYNGVLSEINEIEPSTIENYVNARFVKKYFTLIIGPYREKVIISHFRNNDVFRRLYVAEEMNLIERALRVHFSPSIIDKAISESLNLIEKDPTTTFEEVITLITNVGK